ncbi:uncharacterized protein LOC143576804 [Bidens hawaiensis]|uniref:uncharacterized protein LOC143576804 n=1 Tax=Bidens hawaiensis TaxID=980011 RepID=UPI00404B8D83
MVDPNVKDGASKTELSHGEDAVEKDKAALNLSNTMEEEDDDEFEDEGDEDEEDEEEEDDEELEEEKVNDGENVVVANTKEKVETIKENTVKKDAEKVEEPKSDKKSSENLKSKEKNTTNTSKKKNEKNEDFGTTNGEKIESSRRKKSSKRVETMGMVFMCSSKTKADCFRYKILGLPESKKDQVLKIYRGMRLFLFDVDLRLMYGIFKAAGPGGYNIEPKAFKSEFPSQVRFTVLDDCLPLAEEMFKSVLKENYYSRNKFEGLLKPEQVKKICKLFKEMGRGSRPRSKVKSRRAQPVEPRRTRAEETRRTRPDDRRASRISEKRKRWARDEERRPRSRSPPAREKRRYPEFDRPPAVYHREPPVVYDHEPLVSRYLPPPQPAVGSPVRLYAYEREPLDIPPYVRDRLPEPHTYRVVDRVIDRDRDYLPEPHAYRVVDRERDRVPEPVTYRVVERERERDPYLSYGREPPPPLYREAVYTVPPPEYHLAGREYHHPPAVEAPEYRISGGSRVASYRDESASDYRSTVGLPEYRSRTHYKY